MLIEELATITKDTQVILTDGSFALIHIDREGGIILFNNSIYDGYRSQEFRDYYRNYRYSYCLGRGKPDGFYKSIVESFKLPNVTLGEL